jgi:hypothetical protein
VQIGLYSGLVLPSSCFLCLHSPFVNPRSFSWYFHWIHGLKVSSRSCCYFHCFCCQFCIAFNRKYYNMHFIPIYPIQPSGAMILTYLSLFCQKAFVQISADFNKSTRKADHPFATGNVMNMCTKWIATHVKFKKKRSQEWRCMNHSKNHLVGGDNMHTWLGSFLYS